MDIEIGIVNPMILGMLNYPIKSKTILHKLLAGHFMTVSGHAGHRHTAEMMSPHMPAVKRGCKVSFNYQMTGPQSRSLELFIKRNGLKYRYWRKRGDQV